MKTVFSASMILLSGLEGGALAAGFAIDVHSGRATGMAAAVTAHIDDASAVFYNPAGLAQGKGLDVEIGDTLIVPSFKFLSDTSGVSTSGESNPVPPPHLYAYWGVIDNLSVGIGVFSPYGLRVAWSTGWEGRFLITRSALDTFYINPEVATKLLERIRLGVGLQIVRATVTLDRKVNFIDTEPRVKIGGASWGVGANAGVQVDILPKLLQFGVAYRSAVSSDVNGRVHFDGVPPSAQSQLKDQTAATHLNLPGSVQLGVAAYPLPSLRVAFDMVYTGWQVFQRLAIHFQDQTLDTLQLKKWSHTWNYHLGAEYALDQEWRIRAGLMYDPTPSPSDTITPELPDANRVNIALGGGYRYQNFTFDLGYQIVLITNARSTAPVLPGTYSGVANLASLTVGYHR